MKGTNGVILVFDLTNKESFDLLDTWMDELKNNNKMDISKVLIGNKADLADKIEVPKDEIDNFKKKVNCEYFECSAKTGQNVSEALDEIAKITFLNMKDSQPEVNREESIVLNNNEKVQKKGKCC